MSGFAGLIHLDGRTVDRHDTDRLARALPQFGGTPATAWTGGPAGLVHRLHVITPEDRFERQPWTGSGSARRLVFAGRIDNRDEIAAGLGLSPAALREMADGALCLTALERWGDEAPAHLFGGFAFACWNERDRTLLLCRDPVGGRALYWHRGPRLIAFATTINAILALPDVPRKLNETVIGDMLAGNFFQTHETPYRGIESLRSGEMAVCTPAGVTMRRYWRPQRRTLGLKSHADYVEAVREQLERAVARNLRSGGPVAVSVSGGLDSSGIAATAARQIFPQRLAVYSRLPPAGFNTVETERHYYDERPKVEVLARMHGNMDVTFIDDAAPHAYDREPSRYFAATGVPTGGPQNIGWHAQLYDRVAAAGHRVLITGDSGNFSIGWRGKHRLAELVRRGHWFRAAGEVLALRRTGKSAAAIVRHFIVPPLVPRFIAKAWRRSRGLGPGFIQDTFVASDFARQHRLAEHFDEFSGWSYDNLWGDPFDVRAFWLMNAGEYRRNTRAHNLSIFGFEVRDPLGDARLIEFALNVPEEHFMRGGRPRALQRDAIADRVPREIYDNYKSGVQVAEWFERLTPRREQVLADIESLANSPLASRAVDVDALRRIVQDWPADAKAAKAAGRKFRFGVERAVHIGNFIRWFEGGNR